MRAIMTVLMLFSILFMFNLFRYMELHKNTNVYSFSDYIKYDGGIVYVVNTVLILLLLMLLFFASIA